jgi:hypothetical protein
MRKDTRSVDDLLTRAGELYRASRPQVSEEERAERTRQALARLAATAQARLDEADEIACHLCTRRRPRRPDEAGQYYFDCTECPNARKFWHFSRDFAPGKYRSQQRRWKIRKFFRLWYRIAPLRCRCR